jgi:hypothetical protein
MLKGRLILMLSWSAFAWANFVVGAMIVGGSTRGWQAQMPSNNEEWLLVGASPIVWFLLFMLTGRARIVPWRTH